MALCVFSGNDNTFWQAVAEQVVRDGEPHSNIMIVDDHIEAAEHKCNYILIPLPFSLYRRKLGDFDAGSI